MLTRSFSRSRLWGVRDRESAEGRERRKAFIRSHCSGVVSGEEEEEGGGEEEEEEEEGEDEAAIWIRKRVGWSSCRALGEEWEGMRLRTDVQRNKKGVRRERAWLTRAVSSRAVAQPADHGTGCGRE